MAAALALALVAARAGRGGAAEVGRSGEDAAGDVSRSPRRASTRRRRPTTTRATSSARSSSRCTRSTTSRGRTRSFRTRRRRCPRSRRTAACGRSASGRASISPTIPAFKGKKRELTADDYVYSFKRLLDPRMRAPFLWFLDGKIVGADDVLAKAKEAGRLDYDAPIEGLKALDRYTLQITLKEPDYVLLGYLTQSTMAAVAREVIEAYGDASGWAMANPVGTGPFRLEGVAARAEDRAGGEPEFPRGVFPRERRAGRPRADREDEGQAAAAARPHRHLDHRGIESAAPRVRERRARLRQRSRRSRRQRARPRQRAQAGVRGQGRDAAPGDAAGALLHVLQHGGPGRRRLHAGQDRAAPRDDHGLQHRGDDQGVVAGPGARRHAADSAGSRGPQLRDSSRARRTIRRRRRRCSTSSATSIATRTAGASCRTASRSRS